MAKSIRSKIKRKHRAVFRKTIATDDYQKKMKKIQENLAETIEKQSFNSMDRIAETLETVEDDNNTMSDTEDDKNIGVNATETVNERECTGENKVMFIGRSKRKLKYSYRMKGTERDQNASKEKHSQPKPKPRYHCAF